MLSEGVLKKVGELPLGHTGFLRESNAIEGVYDEESLEQAIIAWAYLLDQERIDHTVVKKTHKILMLKQPLKPYERGYYRDVPVYVSGQKMANHNLIRAELDVWLDSMNRPIPKKATETQKEMITRAEHVTYEKIHPFVDGNGRTGRMFMNWRRLKVGLPLLTIHAGQEQQEYYQWFKS